MLKRAISCITVIGWKVVPRPVLTPLSFRLTAAARIVDHF